MYELHFISIEFFYYSTSKGFLKIVIPCFQWTVSEAGHCGAYRTITNRQLTWLTKNLRNFYRRHTATHLILIKSCPASR